MKHSQFIISCVQEKYGEWLEMAGKDAPALLTDIVASLLAKEVEENTYYKMRLKELEHRIKK